MNIHKLVPRPLTQEETETIEHFRYYFSFRKTFALIGRHTAAVLGEDGGAGLEALRQTALAAMSALLQRPPDFSAYVMDDGFGLTAMDGEIYTVSPERLSQEEIASGKFAFPGALVLRNQCLEACEAGDILAIVTEEAEHGDPYASV